MANFHRIKRFLLTREILSAKFSLSLSLAVYTRVQRVKEMTDAYDPLDFEFEEPIRISPSVPKKK